MLGGGGVFCQLHDVFSSIKPVLDFFGGYCPTLQHPPPFPPTPQKSNGPSLGCYEVLQLHYTSSYLVGHLENKGRKELQGFRI